jgi:hypothetical protein
VTLSNLLGLGVGLTSIFVLIKIYCFSIENCSSCALYLPNYPRVVKCEVFYRGTAISYAKPSTSQIIFVGMGFIKDTLSYS